jgi:hypothetical protein
MCPRSPSRGVEVAIRRGPIDGNRSEYKSVSAPVAKYVPLIEPCQKVTVLGTMAIRRNAGCARSQIEASENEHLEELDRCRKTCVIKGSYFGLSPQELHGSLIEGCGNHGTVLSKAAIV